MADAEAAAGGEQAAPDASLRAALKLAEAEKAKLAATMSAAEEQIEAANASLESSLDDGGGAAGEASTHGEAVVEVADSVPEEEQIEAANASLASSLDDGGGAAGEASTHGEAVVEVADSVPEEAGGSSGGPADAAVAKGGGAAARGPDASSTCEDAAAQEGAVPVAHDSAEEGPAPGSQDIAEEIAWQPDSTESAGEPIEEEEQQADSAAQQAEARSAPPAGEQSDGVPDANAEENRVLLPEEGVVVEEASVGEAAPEAGAADGTVAQPVPEQSTPGGADAAVDEGERVADETAEGECAMPAAAAMPEHSPHPECAAGQAAAPSGQPASTAAGEGSGPEGATADGPSSAARQLEQMDKLAQPGKDEANSCAADAPQPRLQPRQDGTRLAHAPPPKRVSDRVAEHKSRAWKLLDEGESAGALLELADAMRLAPDDPALYASRALALLQADKVSEAIADLEQCLRLDPHDPKIFVRLANLCIGSGDMRKALAVMQEGHALHPNSAELVDLLREYGVNVRVKGTGGEDAERGARMPSSSKRRDAATQCWDACAQPHTPGFAGDGPDYRWQRSTASGRWYSPHTSSITAIEARQRQIREKCVEMNRRKQQKLVQNKKAVLRAAAEQARLAEEEATKARITWQLDLVLDCISIIEKEDLISFQTPGAPANHSKNNIPRFSCTADVVTEILAFLQDNPLADHNGGSIAGQDTHHMRKAKAQVVEAVIKHVLEQSKKPVKRPGMSRLGGNLGMSLQDVMQHVSQDKKTLVSPALKVATTVSTPSPSPSSLPTFFVRRMSMPTPTSESALPAMIEGEEDSGQCSSVGGLRSRTASVPTAALHRGASLRTPSTGLLQPMRSELPPLGATKHAISPGGNPPAAAPASAGGIFAVPIAKRAANQLVNNLGSRRNLSMRGTGNSLREEKEETASWRKLPLKTMSKSLAFAVGLPSRGGFL